MDKIITAQFDSVDAAAIAAKRITDHFNGIRSIRIFYKNTGNSRTEESDLFSGAFLPFPLTAQPMMSSILPPLFYPNSISEWEQSKSHRNAVQKVTVKIKANEKNSGTIAAILRFGGGIGVKVE